MTLKIKTQKDTPLGKAYRTFLQAAVVVYPIILYVALTPDVSRVLSGEIPLTAAIVPILISIATYLQNKYEERRGL